jgi:hypothetical protein
VRLIPKTEVAAYVHGNGLLPALWTAAASEQPWAPAAQALLNHMFDPDSVAVDLDNQDWIDGCAALVYGEVVTQADVDAIAAMYPAPPPWVYTGAVADGPGRWLLVFERDGVQQSIQATTADPAAHAAAILAAGGL